MFGKRKQDHRHIGGEEPGDSVRTPEDPELTAALMQLGRNRDAPLPEPTSVQDASGLDLDLGERSDPETIADESSADEAEGTSGEASPEPSTGEMSAVNELDAPVEDLPPPRDERWDPPGRDVPGVPSWAAVPTAAMLAEPEPEPEPERAQPSAGQMAMQALNRERAKSAEQEAALRQAQDEAEALKAQVNQLRAELAETSDRTAEPNGDDELRSAERADEAERSALELQSKVSELAAELEGARADAAAAGVALERLERETKDQTVALAVAEERSERLAAEVQELRSTSARGAAQAEAEGLQHDAELNLALREVVERSESAAGQIEAAVAETRRLASDLASSVQSQESLVAALAGLQTEVTEQRAWFEAQLATMRQLEGEQNGVVEALQAAVKERDAELDALRLQLLDVEAKRAEEAAAFVAALDRQ